MKKLLLILMLLLVVSPAWSAIQWRGGVGELTIDGTTYANLIGYNSYNKIVQPLDNLLSNYCTEYLQYYGSTTITVKSGSCVVSNAGGSVRMFMLDTGDTNLTATNLDTGVAFSAGTTYYVYATSPNSTTQTSTYYISLSSTAPTGQTYYFKIGQFTTDSSGYITNIMNTIQRTFSAQGTISNGATVSLISGFINDQCKVIVSTNYASDIGPSGFIDALQASVDATTRVVTCQYYNGSWQNATCNYLITCSK